MTRLQSAVSGAVLIICSLFAIAPAAHASTRPPLERCTLTSTHHCVRAGQFCPSASRGHYGWDAHGNRLKCYGGNPPHWHYA
ncbi:hypothetical protein GCM10027076_02610 [Nocardioides montaniterrae]